MRNYVAYRDAYFASSADTFEYVIKRGEEYVFRGVAVKAPDEEYAYINVGEICRQYLKNNMPDFRDFTDQLSRLHSACLKFTISSVHHTIVWTGPTDFIDDVTEQVEEIFRFLFNWDYVSNDWDNDVKPLSDPVNGHLDCRMKLMYTQYGESAGSEFYATPLLSAPTSGASVTAKIVTDLEDPSLLNILLGDSGVTVESYDFHHATYQTPANTGYTRATTAFYYYDGELVGKTDIVIAGDLGGEPVNTDPVIVDGGKGQIAGTAFYTGQSPLRDYIEVIQGSLSGDTFYTVYGSQYITGITSNSDSMDNLYLVLIDENTPAPLGEKVKVTMTSNNVEVRKEYTVTCRWNSLYGDSGVTDYWLVDYFHVETDGSPNGVGSAGASWNLGNSGNTLDCQFSGDLGGRTSALGGTNYSKASGNTIYSSIVIREMNINEHLYTDNSPHFSSVTINSAVTCLHYHKYVSDINGHITTSGITDLYYNGTLAQWNSLENVDEDTWNYYYSAIYNEYYRNAYPRKLKSISFFYPEGSTVKTSLTVHCTDGVTEWSEPPYRTGITINPYVDYIQVTANGDMSNGYTEMSSGLTGATTFIVDDQYYDYNSVGGEAYHYPKDASILAPLGHTFSVKVIKDWTYIGDYNYEVTSRFASGTSGTTALEKTVKETLYFNTADSAVTDNYTYGVRLTIKNNWEQTYPSGAIYFNTIYADNIYAEKMRQDVRLTRSGNDGTVQKSARNNQLTCELNNYTTSDLTVTLTEDHYVAYYINDYSTGYSITDLYIADTVEWFNAIPKVKSLHSGGHGDTFNTIRSKWFRGRSGKSLTVHCRDGNVTWTPDEIV